MSPVGVVAPHVIVFLAAAAATVTGYGFVVLSAPLLTLLLPPAQVVPLTLGLGWALLSVLLVRRTVRGAVNTAAVWRIAAAGAVGVPVGAALLDVLSQQTLQVVLGLGVAASALVPIVVGRAGSEAVDTGAAEWETVGFGPDGRARQRHAAGVYVAGLAAGVLSGCVGLNGPPVALYLAWRRVRKDEARASSAAAVWLLSTITLVFFAVSSRLPIGTVSQGVALAPAMVAGGMAGSALFRAIPLLRFRQVSISFAAAAGIVTMLAGVLR